MKIILKITLLCFSLSLFTVVTKADTTDWVTHVIPGLGSFKMPQGAISNEMMGCTYAFVMIDSTLSLHFQQYPKTMLDTITDTGWQSALMERPDTLMALALTQADMVGNNITDSLFFTAYGRTGLEVTLKTKSELLGEGWLGETTTIRIYDTGTYYLHYFAVDLTEDVIRFELYKNDFYSSIITGTP
jgi:hypothetical protein